MDDRYAGLRQAAVNAQQQLGNPWVLAAYTAAAQPAVVLRLLDRLDAAEDRLNLEPVPGHPDGGSTT